MPQLEIILCDTNRELRLAWKSAFQGLDVQIEGGDFFDIEADAYVSPANSYGYMDGGFDYLLLQRFPGIQQQVQHRIGLLGGRLEVGEAIVVPTEDPFIPFLVCAPTMETPKDVSATQNAYLAMLALLRAIEDHNDDNGDEILSAVVPGLATGIGAIPPDIAANQMARALRDHLGIG